MLTRCDPSRALRPTRSLLWYTYDKALAMTLAIHSYSQSTDQSILQHAVLHLQSYTMHSASWPPLAARESATSLHCSQSLPLALPMYTLPLIQSRHSLLLVLHLFFNFCTSYMVSNITCIQPKALQPQPNPPAHTHACQIDKTRLPTLNRITQHSANTHPQQNRCRLSLQLCSANRTGWGASSV